MGLLFLAHPVETAHGKCITVVRLRTNRSNSSQHIDLSAKHGPTRSSQ